MNPRFKCALCTLIVLALALALAACAAEPEPIILETPIASATPYVTAAPTDAPTHTPRPPTRTPKPSPTAASNIPSQSAKININTAGAAELDQLPHIGPVLAQRIITYRQAQGPFKSIEEIKNVAGIGEAIFNAIKEFITI
jgi:competence protein ComEA